MRNDKVKWIKFKVGMFDGNSFKRIKRAEIDGVYDFRDKLTAVWFELLDLSGKLNNNGYLSNDEIEFNTYEDIAIEIDRTTKEVELCLRWFVNNRMIEVVDNVFLISNWSKYQNIDGLEKIRLQGRERQRAFRENKKLSLPHNKVVEPNDTNVTLPVTLRNGLPLIDKNSSSSSSLRSKEILKTNSNISISNNVQELFDRFWSVYPRKVSKGQAEKTFKKIKPPEELVNDMIEKVKELIKHNWADRDKSKIPHASTWLNAKGWEDEIENPNDKISGGVIKGAKTTRI